MKRVTDPYEALVADIADALWPAAEAPDWNAVRADMTQGQRNAVCVLGVTLARNVFYTRWAELEASLDTRYPTARALLDVWEMPWSGKRIRFAHHRIRALYSAGLDVLDVDRTQPGHDLDR